MVRRTMKVVLVRGARLLALLAIVLLLAGAAGYVVMVRMPGASYRGALPAMTDAQRSLADELRRHVEVLAGDIGPRNTMYVREYEAARRYLRDQLESYGYTVTEQTFPVGDVQCANVIAESAIGTRASADSPAAAGEKGIIVVGAHYDSCFDSPAANDNASGCAAVLALARRFAPGTEQHATAAAPATIRFVLFANEEPPHFTTDSMGSLVYARSCAARGDDIAVMLSLETIGFFSNAPGSQRYPLKPLGWFYPTTGDFIAFVSNVKSRKALRRVVGLFRHHAAFPSQGAALPGGIPGVGWSDHWAFWQAGYPAVMVTDTALFRYLPYHTTQDTPDKLDYQRMARVVDGLERVLTELRGQ